MHAEQTGFNFLGFTVRYDRDILGRNKGFWNIVPSSKSGKKIREKVHDFLGKSGHLAPRHVTQGLNALIRGWLNYYDIPGGSYPSMSRTMLRQYLYERSNRYYNRKSQRRNRLYGHQAFEKLVYNTD